MVALVLMDRTSSLVGLAELLHPELMQ